MLEWFIEYSPFIAGALFLLAGLLSWLDVSRGRSGSSQPRPILEGGIGLGDREFESAYEPDGLYIPEPSATEIAEKWREEQRRGRPARQDSSAPQDSAESPAERRISGELLLDWKQEGGTASVSWQEALVPLFLLRRDEARLGLWRLVTPGEASTALRAVTRWMLPTSASFELKKPGKVERSAQLSLQAGQVVLRLEQRKWSFSQRGEAWLVEQGAQEVMRVEPARAGKPWTLSLLAPILFSDAEWLVLAAVIVVKLYPTVARGA